jgi:hypothetical protein
MQDDRKSENDAIGEDLSQEIARQIAREQVTCRRVSKEHYRCNWWVLQDTAGYDNPRMHGLTVTTSRISQSHFLHVVQDGGMAASC